MLSRRRFLTISAVATLLPGAALAQTHVETAVALGAKVTLRLTHPDAPALAALALAEIRRLERIFSLYLPDSSLSQLNARARLDAPPFELLECLSQVDRVYRASAGRFDPTIQPLWAAEAAAAQRATPLTDRERADAIALIGWQDVAVASQAITLRAGQALTLNGIAQGYIADRTAQLLAENGLTDALIDTGEMVALPGRAWHVKVQGAGRVNLRGRALATSSPFGMTFGPGQAHSHIFDPAAGRPAGFHWQTISISAPSAALADALSTAACLMASEDQVLALCQGFPGAELEAAIRA